MTPVRLSLPAPVRGRIESLDELKGVALLLIIVLYHAAGVLAMADIAHGEVGVDIFVIISGIGLALGTQGESAGRYLARRFLRIYPAYWLALTLFLWGATHLRGLYYTREDIILHYLGIHVWFGHDYALQINDSFWFITLITTLYVVYLPLRRFIDRPDIIIFAGAVLAFTCAAIYLHVGESVPFTHFSLRMPGFFVGLIIGRLLKTGSIEVRPSPWLGAALLLLLYVPYVMSFTFASPVIGLGLMGAYVFLIRLVTLKVTRRILAFLGERSLEIFLIHQPLIREYNTYVHGRFFPQYPLTTPSLVLGMAIGFVVAVLISIPLHAALKPLMRLVPAKAPEAPSPVSA